MSAPKHREHILHALPLASTRFPAPRVGAPAQTSQLDDSRRLAANTKSVQALVARAVVAHCAFLRRRFCEMDSAAPAMAGVNLTLGPAGPGGWVAPRLARPRAAALANRARATRALRRAGSSAHCSAQEASAEFTSRLAQQRATGAAMAARAATRQEKRGRAPLLLGLPSRDAHAKGPALQSPWGLRTRARARFLLA